MLKHETELLVAPPNTPNLVDGQRMTRIPQNVKFPQVYDNVVVATYAMKATERPPSHAVYTLKDAARRDVAVLQTYPGEYRSAQATSFFPAGLQMASVDLHAYWNEALAEKLVLTCAQVEQTGNVVTQPARLSPERTVLRLPRPLRYVVGAEYEVEADTAAASHVHLRPLDTAGVQGELCELFPAERRRITQAVRFRQPMPDAQDLEGFSWWNSATLHAAKLTYLVTTTTPSLFAGRIFKAPHDVEIGTVRDVMAVEVDLQPVTPAASQVWVQLLDAAKRGVGTVVIELNGSARVQAVLFVKLPAEVHALRLTSEWNPSQVEAVKLTSFVRA